MKASIIIPTHKRPEYLPGALASVKAQDFPSQEYEILVVDNAPEPTAELISLCASSGAPAVRYIHEPNRGLHNARHAGAHAAQGDILVYVDDDVTCDRHFLSEILQPYGDPQVGCVGGKILPHYEVDPPEWLKELPKWYLSILDDDEGPKEVRYIYGCSFSIRRSLLFAVGGFNPDAFGDKEMWWYRGDGEIGLLRKVQAAGQKIIYTPQAVVHHFIPKHRLTMEYFRERAFKSGIEASFSAHRYADASQGSSSLPKSMAAFGLRCVFHQVLAVLPVGSIMNHILAASYYRARTLYELRLIYDRNLKSVIRREHWLTA